MNKSLIKIVAVLSLIVFTLSITACGSQSDSKNDKAKNTEITQQEKLNKEKKLKEQQEKERLKKEKKEQERRKKEEEEFEKKRSLKFSDFEVSSWSSLGSKNIRVNFIIENPTNNIINVFMSDFCLRKDGQNTVKPAPADMNGGLSSTVEKPFYRLTSYEMYPGDRIAASIDFWTEEKDLSVEGWAIYYEQYSTLKKICSFHD